jgi:hypothetical protein
LVSLPETMSFKMEGACQYRQSNAHCPIDHHCPDSSPSSLCPRKNCLISVIWQFGRRRLRAKSTYQPHRFEWSGERSDSRHSEIRLGQPLRHRRPTISALLIHNFAMAHIAPSAADVRLPVPWGVGEIPALAHRRPTGSQDGPISNFVCIGNATGHDRAESPPAH